MSSDKCVVDACEASWDEEFIAGVKNKNNCSGFVKSVAKRLGVQLPAAQADGIVDSIDKTWLRIGGGTEAANKAAAGHLVLAGLRSADHSKSVTQGHVAVVISGALYRGKYPTCWGGSTGTAQSRGDKSVGEIWNKIDRDNVRYYAYPSPVCKA